MPGIPHNFRQRPKYPLATVAYYGPDSRTVHKIVVTVFASEKDSKAGRSELRRWVAAGILDDPNTGAEVMDFNREHRVRTVGRSPIILGCVHEEGQDFPEGGDCPFCPFWAGKQGSAAQQGESPWDRLPPLVVTRPDSVDSVLGHEFRQPT